MVYLYGRTDYGDNIEDEWLIVYLLRELSKRFPSLWARMTDNDGEFLLIEAANVLPRWLSPEIDSNRVWIHQGHLHIIPLGVKPEEPGNKLLSLEKAVEFLKLHHDSLVHSAFIEAESFYRLDKYPGQISTSIHHAMVTLPRRLAYILHTKPKSIAPATEAFYLRDPRVLRPLLSGSKAPTFPPTDLVTLSTSFTKVLYAQLVTQQFEPPPPWKDLFATGQTEATDTDELPRGQLAGLNLGLKITFGFELLLSTANETGNPIVREWVLAIEDLLKDGKLPTDEDIKAWPGSNLHDDDSWMDINYQDFERELDGAQNRAPTKNNADTGFGDSGAQADLRKIVSRFEAFLNDQTAGIDGVDLDEMDEDDDDDDDEDDSEDEDKEVSFDEEQFARLMREMMGIPSEAELQSEGNGKPTSLSISGAFKKDEGDGDEDGDEDEEIRGLASQMEAELARHGALALDGQPKETKLRKRIQNAGPSGTLDPDMAAQEESDGDEVDIDYNLAKNLLESFKSQAGVAGPAGNLLGMMGIVLPRDEGEEDDD